MFRSQNQPVIAALQMRITLAQLESKLHEGLISQSTFERCLRLWQWGAVRMAGEAGAKQERFYRRHGREAFHRRIAAVHRLLCEVMAGGAA